MAFLELTGHYQCKPGFGRTFDVWVVGGDKVDRTWLGHISGSI